jgi:mono/diheme cytochrome c family protein
VTGCISQDSIIRWCYLGAQASSKKHLGGFEPNLHWHAHKRLFSWVAATAFALLAVVTVFLLVSVSGTAQPSRLEQFALTRLLEAKIALRHPPKAPPFAPSPADLNRAGAIYGRQCSFCHGGVDGKPGAFGHALSPPPPQFAVQSPRGPLWMDAYIIRHGIRWTGMPAFANLSGADAWRLALFVRSEANQKGKQS